MPDAIEIFSLIDDQGRLHDSARLADMLPIHRQLRPLLPEEVPAYGQMLCRMARDGARLLAATQQGQIAGVAVYRIYENTYQGLRLYIDDLVVDENRRSQGIGHALLAHCTELARQAGCSYLALDSGTQRTLAHKMYFREGLVVTAFNFTQCL